MFADNANGFSILFAASNLNRNLKNLYSPSYLTSTIPKGSAVFHPPRVKSGTSTGDEPFATEISESSVSALHVAAS